MFEYRYNYLHYYFPLYYIIMRERERERDCLVCGHVGDEMAFVFLASWLKKLKSQTIKGF